MRDFPKDIYLARVINSLKNVGCIPDKCIFLARLREISLSLAISRRAHRVVTQHNARNNNDGDTCDRVPRPAGKTALPPIIRFDDNFSLRKDEWKWWAR